MNGTRPDLDTIVESQGGFVRSLAVRLAPWPGLAEDIAQQVFLEFVRKAGQWDLEKDVRPLLATMTRHVALRAWREKSKAMPEQLRELAEHIRSLAEENDAKPQRPEYVQALKNCLGKLPEKSRRLLELHYELDISSVEIARQTTMKSDAVRRALFRLREQLRNCIRGLLGGEA